MLVSDDWMLFSADRMGSASRNWQLMLTPVCGWMEELWLELILQHVGGNSFSISLWLSVQSQDRVTISYIVMLQPRGPLSNTPPQ